MENFLPILDAAIHDKPVAMQNNGNYGALLSMAQAHNVLPLVFEKLCELPDFKGSPEFSAYVKSVIGIVAAQTRRTHAFLELYRTFSAEGMQPIVMKGIVCRQLYGKLCDHRPSGDEDILIREADFEKVKTVLIAHGFVPDREGITESQLDALQEISFYHRGCGLKIEVHTNPIGKENALRAQMNDYFTDVFAYPKQMVIDGTAIWTMNDTDHFLFLILHAFKHMTVTGFGIRQVMDILLYYERNESVIDISYVLDKLEGVKAKKFFSDLIHLGNQYLGFHFVPFDRSYCVEELLEDLLGNGIFGNATQAQQMARSMTNAAVEHGNGNESTKLLRTLFPSRKYMMAGYPELVEKSWLVPVCWMRRWKKFLKNRMQNKGHSVSESIEISNRKIKLLKEYGVLQGK